MRIDTTGKLEFLASGLRTPNGLCFGPNEEIFINDNQGEYLPANRMNILKINGFYGYRDVDFHGTEDLKTEPPVVWMPHYEVANSPSQPLIMKDGIYKGQLIHGDVTHGGIKRVFYEVIDSVYQGCVFNFTQGLEGGINRMAWGPDGSLYVGAIGSAGNWSQENKYWYGLQKLTYNNKSTFEILAIKVLSNGFMIELTEPIAENQIIDNTTFGITQWRYISTEKYGGPKIDEEILPISAVIISDDRKNIRLITSGINENHVCHIKITKPIKSASGQLPWISEGWYTINKIPRPRVIKTYLPQGSFPGAIKAIPKTVTVANASKKDAIDFKIAGKKLIEASGCFQCHSMDAAVVGPAYTKVARRYKNDPKALEKISKKIINGGSGDWGPDAMPAQSHLKKSEITIISKYILSLQ